MFQERLAREIAKFPGGRNAFCLAVDISPGRLSQILNGFDGGGISAELAIKIHHLTHGKVPASLARPDLWQHPTAVPRLRRRPTSVPKSRPAPVAKPRRSNSK